MGLRIFLPDWNDVAAETEVGIVLEHFSEIEVGLRQFLSKKAIGRKGVGHKKICLSKREKESKASQNRSEESRPVSGKENYDRVLFPDRLQKTLCCHFMKPIGNRLVPSMIGGRSQ